MGIYNPNKPSILGMEWVPLTGDVVDLDLGTEWGYGFTVTGAPYNFVDSFNVNIVQPSSQIAGQTVFFTVYPRGRESDTGEIRVSRFAVATAFVTGAVVSGAASATAALDSPGDGSFVLFPTSSAKLRVTLDAVTAVPSGARILGVDLIYQAAGTPGFVLEPTIESNTVIYPYGPYMTGPASLDQVSELGTVRFGDVNPWWDSSGAVGGPNATSLRYPWRTQELARFSSLGTGGQLYIGIRVNTLPLSGFVRLGHLAMNVYWCEESRVAYGGRALGQDLTGALTFTAPSAYQATDVKNPGNFGLSVDTTLTPGDYTATITMADAGDKYNAGDRIQVGSMFQYRPVSTHPTFEITKFKRPSGILPATAPTVADSDFMVGTTFLGDLDPVQYGNAPFDYDALEGAPVYLTTTGTSVYVQQPIHNLASPADTTYEWVRFYARRFNPAQPGDLTVSVSGTGSATVTAAEFAALPELTLGANGAGTGWKEVTLPITAVFSSDATFRNVTFTMTGVSTSVAGDQYQVILVRTFLTNKYKTPVTNFGSGLARYDGIQRVSATWQQTNSFSPQVDTLATAVVMFSQSLAAPADPAATTVSMPVSGIGADCGVPMCIPTAIYGTELTWTAIAVTGAFDHYEIQREDALTDWQSIAIVTGHHTTTFTDWEARVGMQSDYRIRSVNVSDFAGPWSSTFSNTLTAPGISGADTGNSVLIFTSNHGPTGNLAYIMQWEGTPVEDFSFPEAGMVSLQTQYQRDFFTAHHPTERGGVQFSRTMLVQAAAIPAPSLPGFRSLRDLAWQQLPYVCVRDELGNRWFANILVPGGRVVANRGAYIADITVTEVTDTAAAVTV